MIVAQLPSEVETMWWITLAVGLAVAIVVLLLLQMLLGSVKHVERNVIRLWETATTVARNTATTWLLGHTATTLDEIKAEVSRHDHLLEQHGDGS